MNATTIRQTYYDSSISGEVVNVEPYRAMHLGGTPVDVVRFYQNGGQVTAEGYRIKKDGTRYATRQVVLVPVPAVVLAALTVSEHGAVCDCAVTWIKADTYLVISAEGYHLVTGARDEADAASKATAASA